MISLVDGQAAFTVRAIILFTIVYPIDRRAGVVRFENVLIGCVAGVVALLRWPRIRRP